MGKCRKCNEDINTDDELIGCDGFVSSSCVVSSDNIPFIEIEEGDSLRDVILNLINKLKLYSQIINQMQEQIDSCCNNKEDVE